MHPNCLQMTHDGAARCSVHAVFRSSSRCLQFLPALWPRQSQLLFSQLPVRMVCLFHYFLIRFAMNPSFVLLGVFTQALYFSYLVVAVSQASTLYQGSSSDLLCLFSFYCHFTACSIFLDQTATISSVSRKSIFAQLGQMSSNPLFQESLASLPVQHQSSSQAVPGNPCCRVLERLHVFIESMPGHSRRNY